jgi:hypothetical protein
MTLACSDCVLAVGARVVIAADGAELTDAVSTWGALTGAAALSPHPETIAAAVASVMRMAMPMIDARAVLFRPAIPVR